MKKRKEYFIVIKYNNLQLYHVKNKNIACNHKAHTIYELLTKKALIESNEALSSRRRS